MYGKTCFICYFCSLFANWNLFALEAIESMNPEKQALCISEKTFLGAQLPVPVQRFFTIDRSGALPDGQVILMDKPCSEAHLAAIANSRLGRDTVKVEVDDL